MSSKVTIYSKDNCPGCDTAAKIAAAWKFEVEVKKLGVDYTPDFLLETFGVRSVPWIIHEDFQGDLNAFRPYATKVGKTNLS